MLALLGLAAGIIIGLLVEPVLPVFLQPYLPIAIVAALDAILGGTRAWLERTFSDRVFTVSFLSNVLIAGLIVLTRLLPRRSYRPCVKNSVRMLFAFETILILPIFAPIFLA